MCFEKRNNSAAYPHYGSRLFVISLAPVPASVQVFLNAPLSFFVFPAGASAVPADNAVLSAEASDVTSPVAVVVVPIEAFALFVEVVVPTEVFVLPVEAVVPIEVFVLAVAGSAVFVV